jgi:branched-subunit amino acid transport protein
VTTWIVVLAVGLGSYVFRVAPLLLRERVTVGPRFDHAVRLAGTAALSALVVSSLAGAAEGGAAVAVVAAVAAGLVAAARGASMLTVVLVGLGVYAVVEILGAVVS